MEARMRRALRVVSASEALPCVVEIPNRFSEGWCVARRIANASCFSSRVRVKGGLFGLVGEGGIG